MFWVHLIIFTAVCGAAVRAARLAAAACAAPWNTSITITLVLITQLQPRGAAASSSSSGPARDGNMDYTSEQQARHRQPHSRSYADNCQDVMLLKTA